MRRRRFPRLPLAPLTVMVLLAGSALGQAPPEVPTLAVSASGDLSWPAVSGADFYNVYRAVGSGAAPLGSLLCHSPSVAGTILPSPPDPEPGQIHAFVVTGESSAGGEGPPGVSSASIPRYLQGACGPRMRTHVLNRAGYGWAEWARDRIVTLGGLQAYLNEQLDPATVDESSNFTYQVKVAVYDPLVDGIDLIGRDIVTAVYARRQLEHKMTTFWFNHFNTDWDKVAEFFEAKFPDCNTSSDPACDADFPARAHQVAAILVDRDIARFRDLAFNGNFREMLEAATLSAAMLLYLDLHLSVALAPNENQPRELLELHAMGVDAGYTQLDVEELSRLMTGWTVCLKNTTDVDNPLAPCHINYWEAVPGRTWTTNFDISRHDCTPKTLFAGTPYEVNFPGTSTCSTTADATAALAELDQALDAIAAHPATPAFISGKIAELLISDEPTPEMVAGLVTAWNNGGNPQGVGDLREVTRAAVMSPFFLNPGLAGRKVKTPYEQFVSGLRAVRGSTDGLQEILASLTEAGQVPFFNEIPTGYSERGGDWISTGLTLVHQNWGIKLGTYPLSTNFSSQPVPLLNANGISTAPGNAPAIVDFLGQILFGGNMTPAERQAAINYLNTDDTGTPSPYDDARIREVVGLMLGYPNFQEQ